MYWVYILKSQKDGSYYTGYTSNLERRLRKHNNKEVISTRMKGPWVLVYKEMFNTKSEAWLKEHQIKKYKGGEAFRTLINRGGVA